MAEESVPSSIGQPKGGPSLINHHKSVRALKTAILVLAAWWAWLSMCLWPQWSFFEIYQYGAFVPLLLAGLFWIRWQQLPVPASPAQKRLVLVLLVVFSALLLPTRLVHEANTLWRSIGWPLVFGVMGMTLSVLYLLGGANWLKHFCFPVLFFISAVPWPGSVENTLIQPLKAIDTTIAAEALFLCGMPALQKGSTIELSAGQVGVDEACSGIRSFHSTLMMALFLGELYHLRARNRFWLLGGGLVLALVANFIRTFTLSWVCGSRGSEAMAHWHDPLGIFVVFLCMGGVWALAWYLRPRTEVFAPEPPPADYSKTPVDQTPMVPRRLWLVLAVWLIVVEAVVQSWFAFREKGMATQRAWTLEMPVESTLIKDSTQEKTLQQSFHADEILHGRWCDSDGSQWQLFYLNWKHGSKTAQIAKGHWPETCLSNSGKVLRDEPQIKYFEVGPLRLPFRVYTFDDEGRTLHVFHCIWSEQSSSSPGLDIAMQPRVTSRVLSAWKGERNLGQQLLEIGIWGFESEAAAETALIRQLGRIIKPGRS